MSHEPARGRNSLSPLGLFQAQPLIFIPHASQFRYRALIFLALEHNLDSWAYSLSVSWEWGLSPWEIFSPSKSELSDSSSIHQPQFIEQPTCNRWVLRPMATAALNLHFHPAKRWAAALSSTEQYWVALSSTEQQHWAAALSRGRPPLPVPQGPEQAMPSPLLDPQSWRATYRPRPAATRAGKISLANIFVLAPITFSIPAFWVFE